MRFVIVLALLCCCYATEQIRLTSQEKDRLPPQHIKEFDEQHVPYVKQQGQQRPENIKKFIESHISKVLQHFVQQQHKRKIQMDNSSAIDVPTLSVQNIEPFKEEVRKIIKQVETHIPQVINQLIAFKNEKRENQQSVNKDQAVISHNVMTRAVSDNIQKIPNNDKEAASLNQQAVIQHVDKPLVLLLVKEVVKHVYPTFSPTETENLAEVEKKEVQTQSSLPKDERTAKTIISAGIQSVVEQIHQHVPQVLSENIKPVEERDDTQNQQQHIHQLTKTAVSAMENIVKEDTKLVSDNLQQQQQPAHVKDQISQNVTKLVLQNDASVYNVNLTKETIVPENFQDIIQHTHHHIPQVIDQTFALIDGNPSQEQLKVTDHIQGIVEQINQHVPQVANEQKTQVEAIKGDSVTQSDVTQNPQHVPQIIKQHIAVVDKTLNQKHSKVAEHGNVDQVNQHIPYVIDEYKANDKDDKENMTVLDVQGAVEQMHQHVPQVIAQQTDVVDKKSNQKQPNVSEHIEGTVQELQQPIPQVVNEHKTQLKDIEGNSVIPEHVQVNKKADQEPEHIQVDVKQEHQPVPQVINELKSQDQVKDNKENSALPEHIENLVQQIDQHSAQSGDHQKPDKVPSNIEGVVQQIHLQIPQVINRHIDHIAQEQIFYFEPNQNEYAVPQISTINANDQA